MAKKPANRMAWYERMDELFTILIFILAVIALTSPVWLPWIIINGAQP